MGADSPAKPYTRGRETSKPEKKGKLQTSKKVGEMRPIWVKSAEEQKEVENHHWP